MENKKTWSDKIKQLVGFIVGGDFVEGDEDIAHKNEDHPGPTT